jgi:F420-dependent oxidoreductase-like protein
VDFRIFVEPWQGATYADQLAVARAAEAAGYSGFFRSDHYLTIGGDGLPGPTDSWITLGAIARETTAIRLGTMLTSATFRHPGPLAVAVAQVDQMSDGRVDLGIGAGWYEAEHTAYGIPFPAQGERFDRLVEQLQIITGLWSTPVGSTFNHDGAHYRVIDSPALPKPVQQPRPPIVVGGWGLRRTPAIAAEFAAEFNVPNAGPAALETSYGSLSAALQRIGRSVDSVVRSAAYTLCVGRDDAEVARRADAINIDVDELRRSSPLVGTPSEVVERLEPYRAAGVQRIYAQLLDMSDLDHLEFFAAEVM